MSWNDRQTVLDLAIVGTDSTKGHDRVDDASILSNETLVDRVSGRLVVKNPFKLFDVHCQIVRVGDLESNPSCATPPMDIPASGTDGRCGPVSRVAVDDDALDEPRRGQDSIVSRNRNRDQLDQLVYQCSHHRRT